MKAYSESDKNKGGNLMESGCLSVELGRSLKGEGFWRALIENRRKGMFIIN